MFKHCFDKAAPKTPEGINREKQVQRTCFSPLFCHVTSFYQQSIVIKWAASLNMPIPKVAINTMVTNLSTLLRLDTIEIRLRMLARHGSSFQLGLRQDW